MNETDGQNPGAGLHGARALSQRFEMAAARQQPHDCADGPGTFLAMDPGVLKASTVG